VKEARISAKLPALFRQADTAKQGGEASWSLQSAAELSKQLEDMVFKMKKNEVTDLCNWTQAGAILVLEVLERYEDGEASR